MRRAALCTLAILDGQDVLLSRCCRLLRHPHLHRGGVQLVRQVRVFYEWEDFLGTPVEQHGARLVNFAITVVGRTLIATFFAYELILMCVLLVFGSCVRGGFGAHGDSLS